MNMKKIVLFLIAIVSACIAPAQHHAGHNGKVLLIASNPSVSKQTGWPIGVWFAEVAHPYWEFAEAGYTVDIASPDGGEIKFDAFSDPEDPSRYAAFDYVSLGFKKDPVRMEQVKNTLKLSTVNPADYKAIFVCGGQGPMYTFIDNAELHRFFVDFYLTGKPAAAICHGTSILLKTKLPNGKFLVDGKKWTGFASAEEQYADNYVGMQIQPFRIEDEARKMPNSKFVVGAPFAPFAVQDGNLITGQQQNSGAAAAALVIAELERQRKNYPTYVLVHGAWADESAWGFVRSALAVRANVEVVNLPAHGVDLTPKSSVTLTSYATAVANVIKRQPGKVVLVGHSMSGMVISLVAEMIPDKIERLVYVAAYLPRSGESVLALAGQDKESMLGGIFEYNAEKGEKRMAYQREVVVPALCADCPDFMKDNIVKYYSEEPTGPLSEAVTLTSARFGKVPKYYIYASKDYAIGYQLQQQMVKANGAVKKTAVMETSHLPFVVQPQRFIEILTSLK